MPGSSKAHEEKWGASGYSEQGAHKAYKFSADENLYAILGVKNDASMEEIRRAYRRKALEYHPDRAGDSQEKIKEFYILQDAYEVLNDDKKRRIYDKYGVKGIEAMEFAGMFSFFIDMEPDFRTFVNMFAILLAILLLLIFLILISLKYDKKTTIPWPNTFAPLYVFIILYIAPVCFATAASSSSLSSGSTTKKNTNDSSSSLCREPMKKKRFCFKWKEKYSVWLTFFLFVLFTIFFPLHKEGELTDLWTITMLPIFLVSLLLLCFKIQNLVKTISKGHRAFSFENKSFDESNIYNSPNFSKSDTDTPNVSYDLREKLILASGLIKYIIIPIQISLFCIKIDSFVTEISWKHIFIPLWLLPLIEFLIIIAQSLTPSFCLSPLNVHGAGSSAKTTFLILFIPDFLLLLLSCAFLYPFFVMLCHRLARPFIPSPSTAAILSPFFFFLSLLILITISFPLIIKLARNFLLRRFSKIYSSRPSNSSRFGAPVPIIGLLLDH